MCARASPIPRTTRRSTSVGTLNLLEAVRHVGARDAVRLLVDGWRDLRRFRRRADVEDMPKDPESPYGIAKLERRSTIWRTTRACIGLDTVALRYSNVYGPRQDPHGEAGVVAIFCNRILDGEALTVFGDGRRRATTCTCGDVARANLAAATATLPSAAQARRARASTSARASRRRSSSWPRRCSERRASTCRCSTRRHAPASSSVRRSTSRRQQRELGWQPQVDARRRADADVRVLRRAQAEERQST